MGLRFRLRDFHSKKFQQQKNLKILDKTSTAYVKFEVSKFTLGDLKIVGRSQNINMHKLETFRYKYIFALNRAKICQDHLLTTYIFGLYKKKNY